MAREVIKRDGKRELFAAKKIRDSLATACQQANLLEERKNEVVEQVARATIQMAEEKETIATSEIREKILSELDRIEPAVSAAWRRYEQEKKA